MKILLKVLLVGFCLAALSLAGATLWLTLEGKKMIAGKLSHLLHRQVAIERLEFIFPATIQIHNLTIEGKSPARKIEMQMELSSFFTDQLRVPRLVLLESEIQILRALDKRMMFADFPFLSQKPAGYRQQSDHQQNQPTAGVKKKTTLTVEQLVVINGKLEMRDESLPEHVKLNLEQVNMEIRDLELPLRLKQNAFIFSAKVTAAPLPLTGDIVGVHGWMNLLGRDMEAKVIVLEPDGHIGLSARISSQQNDMLVQGRLDLKNLGTMVRENVSTQKATFADTLVSGLHLSGLQMIADFEFQTKMDAFSIKKVELSGNLGFTPAAPVSEEEKQLLADFEKMKGQFERFREHMMEGPKKIGELPQPTAISDP
jgi:hypothetical protein